LEAAGMAAEGEGISIVAEIISAEEAGVSIAAEDDAIIDEEGIGAGISEEDMMMTTISEEDV